MIVRSEKVIRLYAGRYDEFFSEIYDSEIERKLKEKLAKQDYITRDDFIRIGLWKSKRVQRHYKSPENTDSLVREVSAFAFNSTHERIRIEALTLLKGCNYPMASVILHFKYPDLYTIIDFRALWSLWGTEKPPQYYKFDFWWKYVEEVRSISESLNLGIRTIDKALWCYSKENQRYEHAS